MLTQVQPIEPVLNLHINQATAKLWFIVWDLLKGQPSWYYPDRDYEFRPSWAVYDQVLKLRLIHGRLDGKRFEQN